jgi:hypothetical protein
MIGSPEDVGRRVAAFAKETKCSHFVMGMQVPDVDPAKEKNQSMELLATETPPGVSTEARPCRDFPAGSSSDGIALVDGNLLGDHDLDAREVDEVLFIRAYHLEVTCCCIRLFHVLGAIEPQFHHTIELRARESRGFGSLPSQSMRLHVFPDEAEEFGYRLDERRVNVSPGGTPQSSFQAFA